MEAVAWMDRASATDYAALAPMVMRHADQGDPAGRRIVQSAAEQIDTLVRVLFEKGAPRVTLLGGVFQRPQAGLDRVAKLTQAQRCDNPIFSREGD